ncbi:PREDICTED: uncharacterized protein LOC105950124 [Erythranthe guttata]|nr:PREDICTED: uncharacterized protein LOC105950124 [Erythranthe guttata]|eukprot:XP_012828895.1 PREDICTED: uncharacterized protein LOC105950124 [Erythranthe guttata]
MNGSSRNGKTSDFEKTYPGCLGRMVNLFEMNIGVSANKLLTDKPHRDGSPVSRSRSDVTRTSPSHDQIQEKAIVSELRNTSSQRKLNVTPMKMLIAQEMSKEVDMRRSPPNLVAKLMGLDSLPPQEPDRAVQRSHSKGHPRSQSEIPMGNWEQHNGFVHYVEPNEYKDVYEIWQQSQKVTHKGRQHNETASDKKMALVRQKFVEAKRLSMDAKLRQSKQFQDALEVLNSNKDLFLRCLQEPTSGFSQQLYNVQSIAPPPETKRITVLRPSKVADNYNFVGSGNKEGKQMPNNLEKSHQSSPPANWSNNNENTTQPTRIVVLKPSLGKILDDRAMSSSPQSQSARVHGEDFFGDVEDNENHESREVAKAITQQMREKLGRHHRDETGISSVFSNGYVADESSFNKSEIDYPAGNLSDSEVMSPVSRHSWDYVNRLGSPYSSSSFSRASYSPESSVCREAKKRLSERWAMMSSNGTCQEQRHVRRSSSTLGEMLALSEAKKAAMLGEQKGSPNEEIDDANSLLVTPHREWLNGHVSVSDKGKVEVPKEASRSAKSSLKVKVLDVCFSRGTRRLLQTQFSVSKPITPGENQEQPSPISVLDPPFEENDLTAPPVSPVKSDRHDGVELPLNHIKSNLIDKSPPIGSIARTLSWEDSCVDTASSYAVANESSLINARGTDEEEREWFFFVKTLLSAAGLHGELQSSSFTARWHSPGIPLDPSLRDKYIDLNDKATNYTHEAKRRQKRSLQKLVFDCVNAVLVEIGGENGLIKSNSNNNIVDEVWGRMNAWMNECGARDSNDSLAVERVVRKEVVGGKWWVENLRMEVDYLGKEIEVKLLEELVEEAVVELTGRG